MSNDQKKRGSKLFIIGFVVFLSVIIFFVVDMANRTTAPWNKPKKETTAPDSLLPDSLFQTDH